MRKFVAFCLVALLALNVGAKDLQTVVFRTTPEMHCEGCETKIKKNLRFEKGVKEIVTDIPSQTVRIEYDADKTSPEKLAEGFKKIGYEVKVVEEEAEE